MAFLASLGPGLWVTALNVKYRDFRYIIPFIVQFGLYVSPVGFSSKVVPEQWQTLYALNPMVGVIDGFRWAILGGESPLHRDGFWLSWGHHCLLPLARHPPVSQDGKELRRLDLKAKEKPSSSR